MKIWIRFFGDRAFGREVNRTSRQVAEKSLTEIFPAEYCLRTVELPNGRPLFSWIFIFANVEECNRRMFDSFFSVQWQFGHAISLNRKSIHRIYKGLNYTQRFIYLTVLFNEYEPRNANNNEFFYVNDNCWSFPMYKIKKKLSKSFYNWLKFLYHSRNYSVG